MWKYNYDSELKHHGIKGMKWGIRRYQRKDGSYTEAGKKRRILNRLEVHDDYKRAHSHKSVKYMSDNELRARLNRLNMEQQYKNIKQNSSPLSIYRKRGMKLVSKLNTANNTLDGMLKLYNNIGRVKKILAL